MTTILYFLTSSFLMTSMFWLPEGRFTSRWKAFFSILLVLVLAGIYSLVDYPQAHNLVNLVGLPAVVIGIWSQIHHYYQVEDPVTRQQIKWAVIGIVVGALGIFVWQAATLVLAGQEGLLASLARVLARLILTASQIAIPVCFAIAITRFRFWQADLVINRSLVYGVVTLLLGLVFLGVGLGLQNLLERRISRVVSLRSFGRSASGG